MGEKRQQTMLKWKRASLMGFKELKGITAEYQKENFVNLKFFFYVSCFSINFFLLLALSFFFSHIHTHMCMRSKGIFTGYESEKANITRKWYDEISGNYFIFKMFSFWSLNILLLFFVAATYVYMMSSPTRRWWRWEKKLKTRASK